MENKVSKILENRDKIIRKIGSSVGIIFNREERELYNLHVGKDVKVTVKNKEVL